RDWRADVCSSDLIPAAAVAQEQSQASQEGEGATTLDRIQVTGSRIRQVDVETAQPTVTISRADIENQGFQSVGDILQNIAVTGSPSLSRSSPLNAGESPRSEEHTSELQSRENLVCRLL